MSIQKSSLEETLKDPEQDLPFDIILKRKKRQSKLQYNIKCWPQLLDNFKQFYRLEPKKKKSFRAKYQKTKNFKSSHS